ncbi:MAG: hypothetical protein ACTHLA_01640 [Asticcacaulis sp.]|uniref:hypothetical protein n=1 Tax=Asticcacaulis sp. TaxID=1872648 RepID=UPI003F7BE531
MNITTLRDIHDAAESISITALHLSRALEALSGQTHGDAVHQLFAFAAACELVSDKAHMIMENAA